jgi:RNA polymerase sigma factor (sigma-70 family)
MFGRREDKPSPAVDERQLLVAEHSPMLRKYARRLIANPDDAADILQDALVTILCHPKGPTHLEWAAAWCRGILRNVAWHSRRARRRSNEVFVNAGDAILELAERDLDWEHLLAEREMAIQRLSSAREEAVELLYRRYWLEENSTDIAQALNKTPAGVRMKLKRLRTELSRV